jgi:DNA-binding NtrC family response regulator
MRKAIRLLLKSDLYDLTEAKNGNEALRKIEKNNFGLIITDLFLNGITGLDIYKQFKKNIPVLIITGCVDSELAQEAKHEAGANYIEKPFSAQAFKEKVKDILTKNKKK